MNTQRSALTLAAGVLQTVKVPFDPAMRQGIAVVAIKNTGGVNALTTVAFRKVIGEIMYTDTTIGTALSNVATSSVKIQELTGIGYQGIEIDLTSTLGTTAVVVVQWR